MSRKSILSGIAVAVAAAGLAVAFAAGAFGTAQRASTGAPQAKSDRIGVHAAWRIEIRNPNGRVVALRRFHNDLTLGAGVLSSIMRGGQTFGWWEVSLAGASQPCVLNTAAAACVIVPTGHETGPTLTTGHVFGGLTAGGIASGIELKGQAFADRTGAIDTVRTAAFMCPSSIAHDNCDSSNWQQGTSFSGRSITALNVVAGQQVLTTVDITFATA
jgi:hypothetical protein